MAKSNKTPEQKKRAAIRLEVNRLLYERPQVVNEIETLKESLDPKSIAKEKRDEKSRIESQINWLKNADDCELDQPEWKQIWSPIIGQPLALQQEQNRKPFWEQKSSHYWQRNCIWFGVKSLNSVYPVEGSFGFSTKKRTLYSKFFNKPVQFIGPCEDDRLSFDFYCDLHRDEANEFLRNGSGREYFLNRTKDELPRSFYELHCAGVKIFPLPKPKPYLIRRKILKEIESGFDAVSREVADTRKSLKEAKDLLEQIDNSLAYYRDQLTNLESHLSRRRLPENARLAIFEKYNFKCAMCDVPLTLVTPHIDHIKPLAKGGKNEESNYQPLCATCNLSKGAKYEE